MNHSKKILFAVAALLSGGAAAGPMMQPGLWEITTKMEMPGMPVAVPPTKVTHCYTPQDVENGDKTIPRDQSCKLSSHNVVGNKVTWTVSCQDKNGTTTGNGEMTYKGDSYDGTMKMSVKAKGAAPMNMAYRYSGRRLGDCKK